MNITAVSLKDVAPCAEEEGDYTQETVNVQVIQRNEIKAEKVKTCLVEITRLIMHCGMHSHTSAVAGGFAEYIHPLGAEQCRDLHKYKTLHLYQQNIGHIVINGTTTASLTLMGHLKDDGSCEGVTYTEDGHSWSHVVVIASVKVHAQEYLAHVKLDNNEITVASGVVCPYLNGYCIDSKYGETVWDYTPQVSCEEGLTLIYEGNAHLIGTRKNGNYIVIEQEEKIFALSLKGTAHICSGDAWQTEHPKLLVIEKGKHHELKPKMVLLTSNTDLSMYVNSKLLYIEQSYRRAVDKLYVDSIYRRCKIHRETLKNRLLMAPLTSNALGAIIKNQLGYIGRVLGEVLYIGKCIPRLAQIRRTNECYNELPVTSNNRSYFMAPITHILQTHGEQIECSPLMPPLYKLGDEWIGLSPYPIVKEAPTELQVEEEIKLNFGPIQPLSSSGLYTNEEISKVQKTLIFGI